MAEELTPDICVIGGGPGGLAVAAGAAARSIPVVLVEKDQLGGSNLKYGAVPAAALATAAEHHELLRRGPALGVTGAPLQVDFAKLGTHIRAVTETMAPNLSAERLTALGVRVVHGPARFADRRTVTVDETAIRARRFVIATGALPARPALPGLDEVETIGVDAAFDVARKPAHLLVYGAGSRGLELAQAYNRLGVDATVIDEGPALAEEDPELATMVLDRLRAEGVRVCDGITIEGIARRRGGIRITPAGGASEIPIDGSHLLIAAGRRPNVEGLGLEAADIAFNSEGITVDRHLRTTNRRAYAIGDVVAGPALANRAEYQAGLVLKAIVYRLPMRDQPRAVPRVTWTDPALATVGISEAGARRLEMRIRILRYPFAENDRAQAERMPAGAVKVITNPFGRVLGAAMVGHDAGELIGLWSLAVARRLDITALQRFVPPYPSRSEIARRVAASALDPGLTPPWQHRIIEFLRRFG